MVEEAEWMLRDSSVPWLGLVPAHWELVPANKLFRAVTRRDIDGSEPKMSMSRHHGLVRSDVLRTKAASAAQSVAFSVACPDDLVVNKYQAHNGMFARAVERGLITANYSVFAPTARALTAFYAALFASEPYRVAFGIASRGVGDGMAPLYTRAFYRTPCVLPPISEQEAIARWVAHADRAVRRAVQTRKRLIGLLTEAERAFTERIVTAGVTPDQQVRECPAIPGFPMRSTWKTKRLWDTARLRSEKNSPELPLLSVFLDRGVIPYGEGGGQVHKPSTDLTSYQVVRPGDLVLNNQQAWRGSVGVSPSLGIVSPAYVVLGLTPELEPSYARHLFRSRVMVDQFVTASKGVGDIQRDIHIPWLKNVVVPIPPAEEQEEIARFLDERLATVEHQKSLYAREVALLEEYRTRIVADVVTGKSDVRHVAARLPEVDESEPLDEGELLDEEPDLDDLEVVEG